MNIYIEIKLTEALKNAIRETAESATCIFEDELTSEEEKHEAIRKANIVFGNVKPAQLLDEAPGLQWIQFASAGFDGYRKLKTKAIVTNMRDYFSGPCAETMVAGILALYRGIDEFAILKQEKKNGWVILSGPTFIY